jgi:hypothetical protein
MKTLALPLACCSGPLGKEGSFMSHTCCDTKSQGFFGLIRRNSPFMWRIYSNPDPQGSRIRTWSVTWYCKEEVQINKLIDWLFAVLRPRSRIFHSYGDVTIAGGLCSALRAFEQGGIFIVSHLLWQGTSVFPVSSEGPPHLVAFYDTRGDVDDLF